MHLSIDRSMARRLRFIHAYLAGPGSGPFLDVGRHKAQSNMLAPNSRLPLNVWREETTHGGLRRRRAWLSAIPWLRNASCEY